MEGPVSSADPPASSLGSPSAVNRKIKGSMLWQMKRTSATVAVSVQKQAFAEIFSQSSLTVALNVSHLSGCSTNDSQNRDCSTSIWMMKQDTANYKALTWCT